MTNIDYTDPKYRRHADQVVEIDWAAGDVELDYPEGDAAECDRLILAGLMCPPRWVDSGLTDDEITTEISNELHASEGN